MDIIQAVGRAIRKAPDKKTGTIVLPVFIEANDEPETVLEDSSFKPVWDVIRALRSHDEELAEQLDAIRRALGRGAGSTIRLPSKLKVLLPVSISADFADAFDALVVDQTTAPWEFWYGLLEAFVAREGHALVGGNHLEAGYRLGQWVTVQRRFYAKSWLAPDRARRLEALPSWSWRPSADWWPDAFACLEEFVAREGQALVPYGYMENGFRLGQWVGVQRTAYSKSKLAEDRVRRFEALPGWSWDPYAERWEEGFAHLGAFVARTGHARVPSSHVEDGFGLGAWVKWQRTTYSRSTLAADRVDRLEALPGWSWVSLADRWEEAFACLEAFVAREGYARVPLSHVENGYPLGQWVRTQRGFYSNGSLATDRSHRLEILPGWSWDVLADQWAEGFACLEAFVAREGHARVPQDAFEDGFRLGQWITGQRTSYSRSTLAEDRVRCLEALPGWSWRPRADRWPDAFARLEEFVAREGYALVPHDHMENGFRLGAWVTAQRTSYRRSTLALDRVRRLEALPEWSWNARASGWENAFACLERFVAREGRARVPSKHVEDGFRLGPWVGEQRKNHSRSALAQDRVRRLEAVPGWSWGRPG